MTSESFTTELERIIFWKMDFLSEPKKATITSEVC